MARLFGHYQMLLEAIAVNPGQRISRLPPLTESERRTIAQRNETGAALPAVNGAHALFEEQAHLTPDAMAADCFGVSLTYEELNERANRVAAYLRSNGVGPESIVALCAERSLEM